MSVSIKLTEAEVTSTPVVIPMPVVTAPEVADPVVTGGLAVVTVPVDTTPLVREPVVTSLAPVVIETPEVLIFY
jgi:hypothetical protein